MVGIAQLVSAPDCGSGGPGFESLYPPSGAKKLSLLFFFTIGPSPSGKAQDFDSCTRWFESSWPSTCGCGGTGRHARFRFLCESVQVQVLSPAFKNPSPCKRVRVFSSISKIFKGTKLFIKICFHRGYLCSRRFHR